MAASMIFNLIESLYFAVESVPFNLKPMSVGEWICDIIATIGFLFGFMLMFYDVWSYKPKEIITYYGDKITIEKH